MKIFVSIVTWFVAVIACFVAGLLAIPLVPIAVLFAKKVDGISWRLPSWASWLETNDDRDGMLPAGLYEDDIRKTFNRHGWRIASIRWLWRNRAYRFRTIFQFRPNPDTAVVSAVGRKDVGAEGPGFLRVWILDGGQYAFEIYWVKRLYGQRGIRLRIGYKLQPLVRTDRDLWPVSRGTWDKTAWAMPVLFFSPFSKVKG